MFKKRNIKKFEEGDHIVGSKRLRHQVSDEEEHQINIQESLQFRGFKKRPKLFAASTLNADGGTIKTFV
jgi:hypothetical protein